MFSMRETLDHIVDNIIIINRKGRKERLKFVLRVLLLIPPGCLWKILESYVT